MLLTLEGGVELAILLIDSLVVAMMYAKKHFDPSDWLEDITMCVSGHMSKFLQNEMTTSMLRFKSERNNVTRSLGQFDF